MREFFFGRVKSPLIQRFGLVPQWVRTLSTHAIASQAQSRCLNGNLTRLVSAAYAARCVFKLGYGKPFFNYSKSSFAPFAGKSRNAECFSQMFFNSPEASEASFSNIFGNPKTNLKTPRAA